MIAMHYLDSPLHFDFVECVVCLYILPNITLLTYIIGMATDFICLFILLHHHFNFHTVL